MRGGSSSPASRRCRTRWRRSTPAGCARRSSRRRMKPSRSSAFAWASRCCSMRSEEGPTPCLGLYAGDVVRFDPARMVDAAGVRQKVPHMGWSEVNQRAHPLWNGIADGTRFYFAHSYYPVPRGARVLITATVDYPDAREPFTCAIGRDTLFAVQFHPEKSSTAGLRLLANFVSWTALIDIRRGSLPHESIQLFLHQAPTSAPRNAVAAFHAGHPCHRSERRSLRSPAAGRHERRDGVLRRSGRHGAALARAGRAAAFTSST